MNTKNRNVLLILFFALSVLVSFEGLYVFFQNESLDAALLTIAYVFGIICLELLLLMLLSYVSRLLFFSAMGLVLAGNFFFLKLAFFSVFQAFAEPLVVGLIAIVGLIFGLMFYLADCFNKYPGIPAYVCIGLVLVVVPIATSPFGNEAGDRTAELVPVLQQWGAIEFKQKPNIHLISFDSMIPGGIAKKYLDIQSLPYAATIEDNMLEKMPSFSPRVPTENSLNSVMNLDQATIPHGFHYFAGRNPSVLTAIAANNGYKITTGYSSYYFGKKGPYIDHYDGYALPPLKKTVLCIDAETGLIMLARLFGVCTALSQYSGLSTLIGGDLKTGRGMKSDWPSEVLNRIQRRSYEDRPQLSFHYIYRPIGHTPKNYRHVDADQREAYRTYFLQGATVLDKVLRRLVVLIKARDPNSIVLIFGDHGAWLSRGVSSKNDPEFVYLDRHAVELGVLKTGHACASEQAFHYSPSFATPSRVLAAVFRCLAKIPKAVDQLVDFID